MRIADAKLNHKPSQQNRKCIKACVWSIAILFSLVVILLLSQGVVAFAETPDSFVIGIPGRTGCLVCHGDPKVKHSKTQKSLFISQEKMAMSSHKDIPCTKCHTDFVQISEGHKTAPTNFRRVAGLACKNCHEHAKILKTYSRSLHGRLAMSGDPKKGATCADCHGGHDIRSLKKDTEYARDFHLAGEEVCGKCHKDYFESYNDYYHGAAYKMKAGDAPACWDCHGTHDIMSSDNTVSKVNDNKLAKTCGSCHVDESEGLLQFKSMIHRREEVQEDNIVIKYKNQILSWLEDNVWKKVPAFAGND